MDRKYLLMVGLWLSPGDPEKAVALAGRAASVSHDGEASLWCTSYSCIGSSSFC